MHTYDDDAIPAGVVAQMFSVDPKTVVRWANEGKLPCFRTIGGHRRFRKADVDKLLEELSHGSKADASRGQGRDQPGL